MADLTTRILIEIRDQVRETNTRLDHTNVRLDQTVERLDQTVERLDQTVERLDQTVERLDRLESRQIEGELRISTEITKVAGAVERLTDILVDPEYLGGFASQLRDHERRIGELERRTPG